MKKSFTPMRNRKRYKFNGSKNREHLSPEGDTIHKMEIDIAVERVQQMRLNRFYNRCKTLAKC